MKIIIDGEIYDIEDIRTPEEYVTILTEISLAEDYSVPAMFFDRLADVMSNLIADNTFMEGARTDA